MDIEIDNIDSEEVIELMPLTTKVRRILLIARVFDHLGDGKQAVAWAELGKQHAGMAVGPKAALRAIVRKYR